MSGQDERDRPLEVAHQSFKPGTGLTSCCLEGARNEVAALNWIGNARVDSAPPGKAALFAVRFEPELPLPFNTRLQRRVPFGERTSA